MALSIQRKQFMIMFVIVVQMWTLMWVTRAFNPHTPPKVVKEVCHRSGRQLYWYCISVFNTGAAEDADMRSLGYYTIDFAENNATAALNRINSKLIPSQPDPYIQEILHVCKDAFSRLKDILLHRVDPMLVQTGRFNEAKAWVNYGMGLMDSCAAVCHAKPHVACPLRDNVRNTHGVLKLLELVLQLLTEGAM